MRNAHYVLVSETEIENDIEAKITETRELQ